MTKITSAIAAAVLASASFATVALADEGDYYQGANRPTAGEQFAGSRQSQDGVSYGYTGSIAGTQSGTRAVAPAPVGNGSYYEGANRPN